MSQMDMSGRPAMQIELSDDPVTWHHVLVQLAQRIRGAPVRSLDEASATLDVLSVLEQVRVWCGQRAGMVDDA